MNALGEALAGLGPHCRGPVVLLGGSVTGDSAEPLYDVLAELGHLERVDLVVCSGGGSVTAARQLALLCRDFAEAVTIHVPRLARSAGTLLCLSADELVLGPLAELGPVDALVGEAPAADQPQSFLAVEDVRAFGRMARDWFGVTGPEDALQVLALVAQRVFPGSLGNLYRADAYIRAIATELLRFQLPDAADDELAAVVEALVTGRVHEDVITRRDAAALGLRVTHPGPAHERALRQVGRAWEAERDAGVMAAVATAGGCARAGLDSASATPSVSWIREVW